ncbi:MAG TPA: hypothetical protein VFF47_02350 [Nitrospirota bacterium]|nr:hypothetical protein [Nitrospirota bacterium]
MRRGWISVTVTVHYLFDKIEQHRYIESYSYRSFKRGTSLLASLKASCCSISLFFSLSSNILRSDMTHFNILGTGINISF